ncbi:MAG: ABC transporter permease [Leptospiraceae bacterium]|nr:ABC transporter permease [Leptospiraceae bacterium]MCP5497306.1 ABC transporter permease [Leptospiraceae bacterium]
MKLLDKINLLLKLGWRNILRQKKRSVLVISTSFVGMIGVMFTLASMNGYYHSMVVSGIESGLGHVQIRPQGYLNSRKSGMSLFDASGILPFIKLPADVKFSSRLEREGFLKVSTFSRGLLMVGIEPETEKGVSSFEDWLVEGDFFEITNQTDRDIGIIPCLIGKANAIKLDVRTGDTVVLSTTSFDGSYKSALCKIAGVFQSPSEPVDKYTIILKREDLSLLYSDEKDRVGYIVFLGESIERTDFIQSELKKQIPQNAKVEVLSFKDLEPSILALFDIFLQFGWVMNFIVMFGFALILFESVSMSVFERTREIGIIRAIGSSPGMIFWMVIFESSLLTLVGAIAGIILGGGITLYFQSSGLNLMAFSKGMEFMGKFGTVIYPSLTLKNLVSSLTLALITGFLSGIYPAYKAVKISPIRAIYNR